MPCFLCFIPGGSCSRTRILKVVKAHKPLFLERDSKEKGAKISYISMILKAVKIFKLYEETINKERLLQSLQVTGMKE